MTNEELIAYLNSLPPEVRAAIFEGTKRLRDYAEKASHVRARMAETFPEMNPRLRALLSLAIARLL
jgi:hypothetical protein